eukprot:gene11916-12009_t
MGYFIEVARQSSFKRAADNLAIPCSTLSRRISELEKSIGLPLFHRTTRRVELTEGGRIYYDSCVHIFEEAKLAHQQIVDMRQAPCGLIRASLPIDFSVMYLSPILAKFALLYPDISFVFDLTPVHADLSSGRFDLSIRMGLPKEQHLIARKIASLKTGLFASPGYLEKFGTPMHPRDFERHQCLRMSEMPWTLHHTFGEASQVIPATGQFVANNVGMLRQLALNDMGIFMSAEGLTVADVTEGKLVHIMKDWSFAAAAAYAITTTRRLPTKVRVFLDFLSNNSITE